MIDPEVMETAVARSVLQDVASHAIVALSAEGRVLYWSSGAQAITGFSAAEAPGMHFRQLFTEADRVAGIPEVEISTALTTGRAEDSRWHLRKDGSRFWAHGVTTSLPAQECLIKIFRDATEPREAEEQRVLLLNELNHRVKNTLATVHAVVDQTLRAGGVDPALRRDLAGRFRALSKSHDILVSDSWAGADLKSLICEVITPYEQDVSPFVLDGPLVRLHPAQAVSPSLAVHELTTNAVKYGALSVPGGRIQVGWNIGHDGHGARHLSLFWEESGGPVVSPPTRKGFGTKLISQTFRAEDGGRAEAMYRPSGVQCVMLLSLQDEPASALRKEP